MARRTGIITIFAAVVALVLALGAPAALATHQDGHGGGNDRKSGYDDNSSEPQDTNHGKGSDRDGDADGDSGTSYTEDNDTNDGNTADGVADDGDNAHPSGKDRSVENGGSGTQGRSESNPDDSKGPMRYEGDQGDDKANGPGGTDLADQDGNNGCGNDDDFDDDNNGWCGKPRSNDVGGDNTPTCPADDSMEADDCDEDLPPLVGGEVIVDKPCPADDSMEADDCDEDLPPLVGGEVIVDKPCPLFPIMGDLAADLCGDLDVQPSQPESDADVDADADSVLGTRFNAGSDVAAAAVAPAAVAPAAVGAAAVTEGAVLPFTGSADLLPFVAIGLLLIAAGVLGLRRRATN